MKQTILKQIKLFIKSELDSIILTPRESPLDRHDIKDGRVEDENAYNRIVWKRASLQKDLLQIQSSNMLNWLFCRCICNGKEVILVVSHLENSIISGLEYENTPVLIMSCQASLAKELFIAKEEGQTSLSKRRIDQLKFFWSTLRSHTLFHYFR